MWRSLLTLITILFMLVTNVRSAAADDDSGWESPRKQRESSWRYTVAGVTIFGLGYVPAATVGAVSTLDNTFTWMFHGHADSALGWLLVPGVGPFAYALRPNSDDAWHVHSRDEIREAQLLSLASGLVQATGLGLFAYGVATSPGGPPNPQPMKTTAHVTPTATHNSFGLALRWDL